MITHLLKQMRWVALAATLFLASSAFGDLPKAGQAVAGLITTFKAGTEGDTVVLPSLALHVAEGEAATPFLPVGRFELESAGDLMLDLREEYQFQAEFSGEVKLEINGAVALEGKSDGSAPLKGGLLRLNKGANTLKATYRSPEKGAAFFRIWWSPKVGYFAPLPLTALFSKATAETVAAAQRQAGRELFGEFRCAKCHAVESQPDLDMDAPKLDGIGSRRNSAWIAEWVANPHAVKAVARMPQVVRGDSAKADAAAIAAYLGSLKDATPAAAAPKGETEAGATLFTKLHCVACHLAPDGSEKDEQRISLKSAAAKFSDGALFAFLKQPEQHYAWIRMPNFRLSDTEAANLSAYLLANADKVEAKAPESTDALIAKGKELVATAGCVSCHTLSGSTAKVVSKKAAELSGDGLTKGCLADADEGLGKAPKFSFTAEQRDALRAFLKTDKGSLNRHVAWEFAARQTHVLRCTECHGKFEGFPAFEILGGKLKPEWAKSFISGEITNKPRFWIESRMPSFKQRAGDLAAGLAAQHGYPSVTPVEPPIDETMAKEGPKLVSAMGGFSCVQCHGVAKVGATQVFESNGVNLGLSGVRLLKPFYKRWLRGPAAIDPATKMPVYFDEEGKSPLTEVYGGDGDKQLEAIWNYIRMGDKMPPPVGTEVPQ